MSLNTFFVKKTGQLSDHKAVLSPDKRKLAWNIACCGHALGFLYADEGLPQYQERLQAIIEKIVDYVKAFPEIDTIHLEESPLLQPLKKWTQKDAAYGQQFYHQLIDALNATAPGWYCTEPVQRGTSIFSLATLTRLPPSENLPALETFRGEYEMQRQAYYTPQVTHQVLITLVTGPQGAEININCHFDFDTKKSNIVYEIAAMLAAANKTKLPIYFGGDFNKDLLTELPALLQELGDNDPAKQIIEQALAENRLAFMTTPENGCFANDTWKRADGFGAYHPSIPLTSPWQSGYSETCFLLDAQCKLTRKEKFLADLLSNPFSNEDILNLFTKIKDRQDPDTKFIHKQSNPIWDDKRLSFFNRFRKLEQQQPHWQTNTFQKAVGILKQKFIANIEALLHQKNYLAVRALLDTPGVDEFIDFHRGNVFSTGTTSTRKTIEEIEKLLTEVGYPKNTAPVKPSFH